MYWVVSMELVPLTANGPAHPTEVQLGLTDDNVSNVVQRSVVLMGMPHENVPEASPSRPLSVLLSLVLASDGGGESDIGASSVIASGPANVSVLHPTRSKAVRGKRIDAA